MRILRGEYYLPRFMYQTPSMVFINRGGIALKSRCQIVSRLNNPFSFIVDKTPFIARFDGSESIIELFCFIKLWFYNKFTFSIDESPPSSKTCGCHAAMKIACTFKLYVNDQIAAAINIAPLINQLDARQTFLHLSDIVEDSFH